MLSSKWLSSQFASRLSNDARCGAAQITSLTAIVADVVTVRDGHLFRTTVGRRVCSQSKSLEKSISMERDIRVPRENTHVLSAV